MIKRDINFKLLRENLNYLYVRELKSYCLRLSLSEKGKKAALISRIVHFIKTGERIDNPKYPAASCSKGIVVDLNPASLMLKGSYKNDLKSRLFFKKLIGEHFHFIAFGIDWLDERWLCGNPPTYQEFADMWQNQYHIRKENPVVPKEEWAYINFVQGYLAGHSTAKAVDILQAWLCERQKRKDWVDNFLEMCNDGIYH